MRILALAPVVSVSMLVAADGHIVPDQIAGLLQGGALAVLAWVVWYMLAKAFPAHNKALKDQREDFLTYLKENGDALREDRKSFYEAIKKVPKSSPYDASADRR